ncbi:hypothetical protein P3T76_010404 [Phytophthora citrophthora]|uniref:Uncharacterized protein n=1 Tax=Phytophthora citrophthora TaxID=4793 RepID=A0AAD9LHK6_9STRA|nr:hypothetical protein P3T76_010404 [Phytophthora citrophthora]
MLRFEVALGGRDWLNSCNRNDLAFSLSDGHVTWSSALNNTAVAIYLYVTRLGVVPSRIAVLRCSLPMKKLERRRTARLSPWCHDAGARRGGDWRNPWAWRARISWPTHVAGFMAATLEHGPGQDIPIMHSEPGDLEDTVEMQAGVLSVTGWVERASAQCELVWWEHDGCQLLSPPPPSGLISYGEVEFPPYDITVESDSKPYVGKRKLFMKNEFWMLHGTQPSPQTFYPALQSNVTC